VERRGHTSTYLADGRVLIVGGENQNGLVAGSELLDPGSGTIASGPTLLTKRTDHSATVLPDGKVLIAGGRGPNGPLASTELFDPAINNFVPGPAMTYARAAHSATVLGDGRILVAGGDAAGTAEIFDPTTQSFAPLTVSLTTPRAFHGAALLQDARVLIAGGARANAALDSAEIFDPTAPGFALLANPMGSARFNPTLRVLPDGKVQVIGGDDESTMEVFEPAGEVFNGLAHLPPGLSLLEETLSSQTRAALFTAAIRENPAVRGVSEGTLALLDREDHTLTEIPDANQAVVAGGVDSGGRALRSVAVLSSTKATVTTDRSDYAPGETVIITGLGWRPGERVSIVVHEEPMGAPDLTLEAVVDSSGRFTNTEFSPDEGDVGRKFVLTAIGQTSGFTAQTTFADAANVRVRTTPSTGPSITVSWEKFSNTTCSGSPSTTGSTSVNNSGFTKTTSASATESVKLTVPAVASGQVFTGWSGAVTSSGNPLCVQGASTGNINLTAGYAADTTAPAAPTLTGSTPSSPANNNSPTITGTAEAGATVKLYTNSACTSAVAGTGTAPGGAFAIGVTVGDDTTTTFYGTATDAAGNTSGCSATSVTYVEDSAAPAAPVLTGSSPASPANNNGPTITGTAEAGTTVKLYTNSACTSAVAGTGTAPGGAFAIGVAVGDNTTTTFYGTATDAAGNTSACSGTSVTYVEDSTAPAKPTITGSDPASPATSTSPKVQGTAEAGSTVTLYTDGSCAGAVAASGTAAAFASPGLAVSVGANSSTTFYATATDSADNVSACSDGFTYVADSSAPSSLIAFPVSGASYNESGWNAGCSTAGVGDFCGTASDSGAAGIQKVEVSIKRESSGLYWDGSAFASATEMFFEATGTTGWSASFAFSNFPVNGDYTIHARATDNAGNPEASPTVTFTIDGSAPASTIDFPVSGASYNESGWNAGCSTAGVGDFCGTMNDSGGAGIEKVEVSIKRESDGLYWNGSAFAGATEVFFEATLDSASWSYAFDFASFPANGDYTIHARATDNAGNAEAGATVTFTIDASAPASTIDFPVSGASYNESGWNAGCSTAGVGDFCGTMNDSGGAGIQKVEVSIKRNGAPPQFWSGTAFDSASEVFFEATLAGASWSYPFDFASFPADGTYTIHARATDSAGNAEASPTVTFTIDSTPPDTIIDTGPTGAVSSTSATFEFHSTELDSTFECRLDASSPSDPFTPCSSPAAYSALGQGGHTFEVRAIDPAGNADPTPAPRTWTVDTLVPAAPTLTGSSPASPANNNGPTITGTAEAGTTVKLYTNSACTSAVAGTGTAPGGAFAIGVTVGDDTTTTFYGTATDAAGNTSGCSATSVTYVEDSAAPAVTIVSVSPAPTTSGTTVTWKASENGSYSVRIGSTGCSDGTVADSATYAGAPDGTVGSAVSGAHLAVGANEIRVCVTDAAGNTGSATSSVTKVTPTATGTLIVKKHVINDAGGTAMASDFTLSVTGGNATPDSFVGDESGTAVTLEAGSYSVSETGGPAGYLAGFSSECSGTIAAGETKTCIVTNDQVRTGGPDFCDERSVVSLLSPANRRFLNNQGVDILVRVDLGESIQAALDGATDVNGDGYILIGVIANASGAPGGHTTQRIVISRSYPKPFGLIGCSVTMHDPNPAAGQPTAWITGAASSPTNSATNLFVMNLHAADSGFAGWKVDGDGRELRNVKASDNATGIWLVGNSNKVRGSVVEGNSGVGVKVEGSSNLIDTSDAMANGGHGFEVAGNGNQLLRLDAGDRGRGNGVAGVNASDGMNVSGDGNVISESIVLANTGNGISVAGNNNQLLKNVAGDVGKGNAGDGIRLVGWGNLADGNKARSNTGNGFNVSGGTSGSPNKLRNNQSNTGASGSPSENQQAEYVWLGWVKNQGGGNKADNITVPKTSNPPKCPAFPATNATTNFSSPSACE
jgi:hypothetical protein